MPKTYFSYVFGLYPRIPGSQLLKPWKFPDKCHYGIFCYVNKVTFRRFSGNKQKASSLLGECSPPPVSKEGRRATSWINQQQTMIESTTPIQQSLRENPKGLDSDSFQTGEDMERWDWRTRRGHGNSEPFPHIHLFPWLLSSYSLPYPLIT